MDRYIDDMYAWDVYNYANVGNTNEENFQKEYIPLNGIVVRMENGDGYPFSLYKPAMLLSPFWYVYKGMYGWAGFFNAIILLIYGVLLQFSLPVAVGTGIGMWLFFGTFSVCAYRSRIYRVLKRRKLLRRPPEYIKELDESLQKEGRTSKLPVVIFAIIEIILVYLITNISFLG